MLRNVQKSLFLTGTVLLSLTTGLRPNLAQPVTPIPPPSQPIPNPRWGRPLEAYQFRPGLLATVGRNAQGQPTWFRIATTALLNPENQPIGNPSTLPHMFARGEDIEIIDLFAPPQLLGRRPGLGLDDHATYCSSGCGRPYEHEQVQILSIFRSYWQSEYAAFTTTGFSRDVSDLTFHLRRLQRPWAEWRALLGPPVEAYEYLPGLLLLVQRNAQGQPVQIIVQGDIFPDTYAQWARVGWPYRLPEPKPLPNTVLLPYWAMVRQSLSAAQAMGLIERLVPHATRGQRSPNYGLTTCRHERRRDCVTDFSYERVTIRHLTNTVILPISHPKRYFPNGPARLEITWAHK
jgi:hypothetical protein